MTEDQSIPPSVSWAAIPMPPEIAVAVLDVMSKVKALEKDAVTGGVSKFKYTSVDQFFELLGPLMAQAGIFTVLHELNAVIDQRTTTFDNGGSKTSTWMTTEYAIWIYHKIGAVYGPVMRKIQVLASGPQSYGMGPSYVEKYFLRSLFKVPTGDDDADNHPKSGLPANDQRREPDRSRDEDRASAEKRARDYIADAKTQWGKLRSQAEMGVWWRSAKEAVFNSVFQGKEDPLYKEFTAVFSEHGAMLPPEAPAGSTASTNGNGADKPKDDVPGFTGDGRPSESSIRMNFKSALMRTVGREDCNEAFIKHVEPYEKSLPKPFLDEMYKLLQARCDEVDK